MNYIFKKEFDNVNSFQNVKQGLIILKKNRQLFINDILIEVGLDWFTVVENRIYFTKIDEKFYYEIDSHKIEQFFDDIPNSDLQENLRLIVIDSKIG